MMYAYGMYLYCVKLPDGTRRVIRSRRFYRKGEVMPPALVTPPKIDRPGRSGGSKYVNEEYVDDVVKLCQEGWVGDLIEPVDTIVKARIASKAWKAVLTEKMGKPSDAYAVRVYTPTDDKGKLQTGKFTFAITLKEGA